MLQKVYQKSRLVEMALGLCLGVCLLVCGSASASQHVLGIDGLDMAKFKPNSLELRSYYIHYDSDTIRGNNGKNTGINFGRDTDAIGVKAIWMTPVKLLGADYGVQLTTSLVRNEGELKIGGESDSDNATGFRNLQLSPLTLNWAFDNANIFASYDLFIPIDDRHNNKLVDPSFEEWAHMFSVGGKVFLDTGKTWALSGATRFMVSHEEDNSYTAPSIMIEAAIGKKIGNWELGICGAWEQQISDNEINDTDVGLRYRVFQAGPEVKYEFVEAGVSVRAAWMNEFGVKNGYDGNRFMLAISKSF